MAPWPPIAGGFKKTYSETMIGEAQKRTSPTAEQGTHRAQNAAAYFFGVQATPNLAAFYAGLPSAGLGETEQWLHSGVLIAMVALTVSPVRFLHPNLAP